MYVALVVNTRAMHIFKESMVLTSMIAFFFFFFKLLLSKLRRFGSI